MYLNMQFMHPSTLAKATNCTLQQFLANFLMSHILMHWHYHQVLATNSYLLFHFHIPTQQPPLSIYQKIELVAGDGKCLKQILSIGVTSLFSNLRFWVIVIVFLMNNYFTSFHGKKCDRLPTGFWYKKTAHLWHMPKLYIIW